MATGLSERERTAAPGLFCQYRVLFDRFIADAPQVTLQPSPDDLKAGISFDQARQKEETFFKSQQPWSDITLSLRNRMGTNKLAQHLSELLFVMIKKEYATARKLMPR